MRRKTGLEFDLWCAQYYASKVQTSRSRGIEFSLTYQQVRNMLKAKKCFLTGVALTHNNGGNLSGTDVTLDRMDASKGYVTGNVHAVCYAANNAKSAFENPAGIIGFKEVEKMMAKVNKYLKGEH